MKYFKYPCLCSCIGTRSAEGSKGRDVSTCAKLSNKRWLLVTKADVEWGQSLQGSGTSWNGRGLEAVDENEEGGDGKARGNIDGVYLQRKGTAEGSKGRAFGSKGTIKMLNRKGERLF